MERVFPVTLESVLVVPIPKLPFNNIIFEVPIIFPVTPRLPDIFALPEIIKFPFVFNIGVFKYICDLP